jgi:hypothetical protein
MQLSSNRRVQLATGGLLHARMGLRKAWACLTCRLTSEVLGGHEAGVAQEARRFLFGGFGTLSPSIRGCAKLEG